MKDDVRDDVRDESLRIPLYKGFLLKKGRDERVLHHVNRKCGFNQRKVEHYDKKVNIILDISKVMRIFAP